MINKICFVVPCRYVEEFGFLTYICVKSIRINYPNDDIFVVDSDSATKDYSDKLVKKYGVKFLNIKNRNYSTGGLWYVYDMFRSKYDYYFLIHDSTKILKTLNISKNLMVAPVMCGKDWLWPRKNTSSKTGIRSPEWAIKQCQIHGEPFNEDFHSLLGPMFLVNQKVLKDISNSGFYKIRPENKFESENMERLWALKFTNLGLGRDMKNNSMLGDFREAKYNRFFGDKIIKTHQIQDGDVIQKFWVERQ